jgi:hypothetical protein
MGTPTNPTRSRTGASEAERRPRVRGSGPGANGPSDGRDQQYDLLTAALLGLAIGAGTTLLLRRGPSGGRPISPALRWARRNAKVGARAAGRGARYAWDRGVDAWERLPREEIEERLRDYFDSARAAIEHAVEHELKDLRKALRRRRRKLGL